MKRLAIACVLVSACAVAEDRPDASRTDVSSEPPSCADAGLYENMHVERAVRSPDGEGFCCEPGEPTCSCGYLGGFVRERCDCARRDGLDSPFAPCDLAPVDWVMTTDEHGCERYGARWPPTGCCGCELDAGAR